MQLHSKNKPSAHKRLGQASLVSLHENIHKARFWEYEGERAPWVPKGAAPAQAVLQGCCSIPLQPLPLSRGEEEGWGWQSTAGSVPRRALWKREMLSQHERNIRKPLGGRKARLPKNPLLGCWVVYFLREEDEGLAKRTTFMPRAASRKPGGLWLDGSAPREPGTALPVWCRSGSSARQLRLSKAGL